MVIDEKTKVSLFAAGACLPFLIGAILWLASVASDAKEAKTQATGLMALVLDIRERVIRIEERQNSTGR
jgi:hypothetical protein